MRMAYFIFFFKQKTAYEMRISDWSSDVCSSDLSSSGTGALSGAGCSPPGGVMLGSASGAGSDAASGSSGSGSSGAASGSGSGGRATVTVDSSVPYNTMATSPSQSAGAR